MLALGVLAIALLRGLLIGAVREAFSLGALAAATIAVRLWSQPAAEWLAERFGWELGPLGWRIAAGVGIVIAVVFGIAIVGRFVRKGIRAAGLGMADRLAGGVLGAAEGALVVSLLVLLGLTFVGRDHPLLEDSRAVEAFETAREVARGEGMPDVAAPAARR